jgi:hypothetical protein
MRAGPPGGSGGADCSSGERGEPDMSGWYTPVKGKCTWWRESVHDDDAHNTSVKLPEKRVQCMCMIEGRGWTFTHAEVPSDCPESRRCRYYIKNT